VHAGPPPLQTLSLNRGTSKRTPRLSPNERQSKPLRPGGKKEFFGEGRGDGVLWIHLSVFFFVLSLECKSSGQWIAAVRSVYEKGSSALGF
jgi:hypothetical protein